MSMIAQGDIQDNDFSCAYHKGKRAGIKEVVDWINQQHKYSTGAGDFYEINDLDLQAKLKEWGL